MRQLESPLVWTSSSRLAPPVPNPVLSLTCGSWSAEPVPANWVTHYDHELGILGIRKREAHRRRDTIEGENQNLPGITARCRNVWHNNGGIWRLSRTSYGYVKVGTLLGSVVDGERECRGCS